jgi:hypothetical protein
VLAAIKREVEAGTAPSEVPRKVKEGGINYSHKVDSHPWAKGGIAAYPPRGTGKR